MRGVWEKFVKRLLQQSGRSPRKVRSNRCPALEAYEDRLVPATIQLTSGVITITGTSSSDVSRVEIEANNPATILDDRVRVSLSNSMGSLTVWYDRFATNGQLPISKVIFNGYAGDDQFYTRRGEMWHI